MKTSTPAWALAAALAVLVSAVGAGQITSATPREGTTPVQAPAEQTATCTSSVGPGLTPPTSVRTGIPGYHAHWYGQSGYAALCPGARSTAVVAYLNTGTAGWIKGREGETAYLGTWGPDPGQDRPSPLGGVATGWPSASRIASQSAEWVGPGQVAWFEFTFEAPATPGTYELYLRPLIEGRTWLEDFGVFWVVTVLNPDGSLPPPPPVGCTNECWPLSGQRHYGGPVDRRGFNVRIDNATPARPHVGISDADMIFEVLVEGGITRLSAIFHSTDPAAIGSVRSGRLSDRYITPMTRGALVYSGATNEETALFKQDAAAGLYFDLNPNYQAAGYYRVSNRPNPHNMFTSAAGVRAAMTRLGGTAPVQLPQWDFLRKAGHAATAGGFEGSVPASTLTIPYRSSATVRYDYDPGTRTYARYQDTRGIMTREVDAGNGRAIAAANVVIVHTDIWETAIIQDRFGSKGLDMRLTGEGAATIFRDGRRLDGRWQRASIHDAFTFSTSAGEKVYLSPGQTWVHPVYATWTISSR